MGKTKKIRKIHWARKIIAFLVMAAMLADYPLIVLGAQFTDGDNNAAAPPGAGALSGVLPASMPTEWNDIRDAADMMAFLAGTYDRPGWSNTVPDFRLTTNITITQTARVLGRPGTFTGMFYGAGYSITGLRLRGGTSTGLIQTAANGAVIRDVTIVGAGNAPIATGANVIGDNLSVFLDRAPGTGTSAINNGTPSLMEANGRAGIVAGTVSGGTVTIENVNLTGHMAMRVDRGTVAGTSIGGFVGQVNAGATLNMIDTGAANLEVQHVAGVTTNVGGVVGLVNGTLNISSSDTDRNEMHVNIRSTNAAGTGAMTAANNPERAGGVVGYGGASANITIADTNVRPAIGNALAPAGANNSRQIIMGRTHVGGFVGRASGGTLTITNGSSIGHNGTVADTTFSAIRRVSGTQANLRMGGIIGSTAANTTLNNVRNYGAVYITSGDGMGSLAVTSPQIAGIVGRAEGVINLTNVHNRGRVESMGHSSGTFAAGVIAHSGMLTANNISNTGPVRTSSSTSGVTGSAGANSRTGGIVSVITHSSAMTNVTNHETATVAHAGSASDNNLGGIIARVQAPLTMTDAINRALVHTSQVGGDVGGANFNTFLAARTTWLVRLNHGGVIGVVAASAATTLNNVENHGSVRNRSGGHSSGNGSRTGGIIAATHSVVTINGALNTGLVESTDGGSVGDIRSYFGGIIGRTYAAANLNNVENTGRITNNSQRTIGDNAVGGIIGRTGNNVVIIGAINRGTLETQANTGTNSAQTSATIAVGGIVGRVGGTGNRIENAGNFGTITTGNRRGGIVGSNDGAGTIINASFNAGQVNGHTNGGGGGIIGRLTQNATVENVYNIGFMGGGGHGILGRRTGGTLTLRNAYVSARAEGNAIAAAAGDGINHVMATNVWVDVHTARLVTAAHLQTARPGVEATTSITLGMGILAGLTGGPWRVGINHFDIDGQELHSTLPYFAWQIPGGGARYPQFFENISNPQFSGIVSRPGPFAGANNLMTYSTGAFSHAGIRMFNPYAAAMHPLMTGATNTQTINRLAATPAHLISGENHLTTGLISPNGVLAFAEPPGRGWITIQMRCIETGEVIDNGVLNFGPSDNRGEAPGPASRMILRAELAPPALMPTVTATAPGFRPVAVTGRPIGPVTPTHPGGLAGTPADVPFAMNPRWLTPVPQRQNFLNNRNNVVGANGLPQSPDLGAPIDGHEAPTLRGDEDNTAIYILMHRVRLHRPVDFFLYDNTFGPLGNGRDEDGNVLPGAMLNSPANGEVRQMTEFDLRIPCPVPACPGTGTCSDCQYLQRFGRVLGRAGAAHRSPSATIAVNEFFRASYPGYYSYYRLVLQDIVNVYLDNPAHPGFDISNTEAFRVYVGLTPITPVRENNRVVFAVPTGTYAANGEPELRALDVNQSNIFITNPIGAVNQPLSSPGWIPTPPIVRPFVQRGVLHWGVNAPPPLPDIAVPNGANIPLLPVTGTWTPDFPITNGNTGQWNLGSSVTLYSQITLDLYGTDYFYQVLNPSCPSLANPIPWRVSNLYDSQRGYTYYEIRIPGEYEDCDSDCDTCSGAGCPAYETVAVFEDLQEFGTVIIVLEPDVRSWITFYAQDGVDVTDAEFYPLPTMPGSHLLPDDNTAYRYTPFPGARTGPVAGGVTLHTVGDTIADTPEPVRAGFEHIGWRWLNPPPDPDDPDPEIIKTCAEVLAMPVTGPKIFEAVWMSTIQYVTFDFNDGVRTSQTFEVLAMHNITDSNPPVPDEIIYASRPGFFFNGWMFEGTDILFDPTDAIISGSITLVASWYRPAPNPGTGAILGFVHCDDTGDPIEGARVTIPALGLYVYTDNYGFYHFNHLPPANYVVFVQSAPYCGSDSTDHPHNAHNPHWYHVTAEANEEIWRDFDLDPVPVGETAPLFIYGQVTDMFGTPVADARVFKNGDMTAYVRTDDGGFYVFSDVPPSTVRINAYAQNIGAAYEANVVVTNANVRQDLSLRVAVMLMVRLVDAHDPTNIVYVDLRDTGLLLPDVITVNRPDLAALITAGRVDSGFVYYPGCPLLVGYVDLDLRNLQPGSHVIDFLVEYIHVQVRARHVMILDDGTEIELAGTVSTYRGAANSPVIISARVQTGIRLTGHDLDALGYNATPGDRYAILPNGNVDTFFPDLNPGEYVYVTFYYEADLVPVTLINRHYENVGTAYTDSVPTIIYVMRGTEDFLVSSVNPPELSEFSGIVPVSGATLLPDDSVEIASVDGAITIIFRFRSLITTVRVYAYEYVSGSYVQIAPHPWQIVTDVIEGMPLGAQIDTPAPAGFINPRVRPTGLALDDDVPQGGGSVRFAFDRSVLPDAVQINIIEVIGATTRVIAREYRDLQFDGSVTVNPSAVLTAANVLDLYEPIPNSEIAGNLDDRIATYADPASQIINIRVRRITRTITVEARLATANVLLATAAPSTGHRLGEISVVNVNAAFPAGTSFGSGLTVEDFRLVGSAFQAIEITPTGDLVLTFYFVLRDETQLTVPVELRCADTDILIHSFSINATRGTFVTVIAPTDIVGWANPDPVQYGPFMIPLAGDYETAQIGRDVITFEYDRDNVRVNITFVDENDDPLPAAYTADLINQIYIDRGTYAVINPPAVNGWVIADTQAQDVRVPGAGTAQGNHGDYDVIFRYTRVENVIDRYTVQLTILGVNADGDALYNVVKRVPRNIPVTVGSFNMNDAYQFSRVSYALASDPAVEIAQNNAPSISVGVGAENIIVTFEYISVRATAILELRRESDNFLLLSVTVPNAGLVGDEFIRRAPVVPNHEFVTVQGGTPGNLYGSVAALSAVNADNTIVFLYRPSLGRVQVVLREVSIADNAVILNELRRENTDFHYGQTRTIIAPDLLANFYTLVSVPGEYTHTDNALPHTIYFNYVKQVTPMTVLAVNAITGEEISRLPAVNVRRGEPHVFNAPSVPVADYALIGLATRTKVVTAAAADYVRFYFMPLTEDDVVVTLWEVPVVGPNVMFGQQIISAVVGSRVTVEAPDLSSEGLTLVNAANYSATITVPGAASFYYQREPDVAFTVELWNDSANAPVAMSGFPATVAVAANTSMTFIAPNVPGFVLTDPLEWYYVLVAADGARTVRFYYTPIEEIVDDFTTLVTVNGQRGDGSLLYSFTTRIRHNHDAT
ncbi:MAG: carboxypeptidase regulatory-like domain-containing protein, partial [Defluviitaleaceae bacterium]|nr:carboxypeptidase regulatory-like domain-containing protein [Defluviitaleaceae bacterium]